MSQPSGSKDLSQTMAHSPAFQMHSGTPIINKLDHQIRLHNGSTSILELSPQRLQLAKQNPPVSLSARIEELTRESGYHRQEIKFYREGGFENLQQLRESVYDVSQQLFIAHYLDHDDSRLDEIIAQLRNALEASKRRERKAKEAWLGFWGIDNIGQEHGGNLI
jgi:hypothetical protein